MGRGNYEWTYGWNESTSHFYTLPVHADLLDRAITITTDDVDDDDDNIVTIAADPVTVFVETSDYNHVVLFTRNLPRATWAANFLKRCGLIDYYNTNKDRDGYLVTRESSVADLDAEVYKGIPVFLYVKVRTKCYWLYTLLQSNYYIFGIGALGIYRSPGQ